MMGPGEKGEQGNEGALCGGPESKYFCFAGQIVSMATTGML